VRVAVPAATQALARADLADLRVVDGQSRQWPYLLAAEHRSEWVELPRGERRSKNKRTELTLPLAVTPVVADQLEVTSTRPFRPRLRAQRAGCVRPRAGDQPRASGSPGGRGAGGDDRVRAPAAHGADAVDRRWRRRAAVLAWRAPAPAFAELFVAAPAGSYTLLVGREQDTAPSYELARVPELVLGVGAEEAWLRRSNRTRITASRRRWRAATGPVTWPCGRR